MSQITNTPNRQKKLSIVIDGHLVTMHFSEKPRPDVYNEIRRMLLSAYQENRICTFVDKEKV